MKEVGLGFKPGVKDRGSYGCTVFGSVVLARV